MTNQKKETVLMAQSLSGLNRGQIITAVSVFFICLFITTLFLRQRIEWNKKIEESLDLVSFYKAQALQLQKQDSLKKVFFRKHSFDPTNESGKRIYGFFEDTEQKSTIADIAIKFNVPQVQAVKTAGSGFVVPVKAVHLVQKGESLGKIAQIYYRKPQDSLLIRAFNKTIKANDIVFIPFE